VPVPLVCHKASFNVLALLHRTTDMPRQKGYSFTTRSHNKKVTRTGSTFSVRPANSLEDQENVPSILDARELATAKILQELSSQVNISPEDRVSSLLRELKNNRTMLYRSRKLAVEHKKKMVG